MENSMPQSPSVEDLLAARSRCFREAGFSSTSSAATNSIYSTITTLSLQTDLDVSDAARLAMAEESANPVWSPAMSRNYEHGFGEEEEGNTTCSSSSLSGPVRQTGDGAESSNGDTETETDGESLLDGKQEQREGRSSYLPTPTLSESTYSISPSLGSIRMASLVQQAPARASGLGISTLTTSSTAAAVFSSSSATTSIDNDADTSTTAMPTTASSSSSLNHHDPASMAAGSPASRRVLNARNLIINTTGIAAERPYPLQSTTPPIPMPKSAELQAPSSSSSAAASSSLPSSFSAAGHVPPPPTLTSRSLSDSNARTPVATAHSALSRSGNSSSSSSFKTAGPPSAPHTAVPSLRSTSSQSPTKHVKRSSTESSLSYLSSPTADEDDTIGPNKASLLRMQSFLGPKMKHISPAPWSLEGTSDAASLPSISASNSSSSLQHSDTVSDIWAEIDSEVGSVRMATKAPRSSTKSAATGTLKGLGMAIASASAAVAASVPSRPSLSSERPFKSRTTTASSAVSQFSSTSRGTLPDSLRGGGLLIRSQSQEPFDATSLPLPLAGGGSMKVTNIVRSKSPDSLPPLPSSAPAKSNNAGSGSRTTSIAAAHQQGSPLASPMDQTFARLTTVTSAPEAGVGSGSSNINANNSLDGNVASLSTSLPETAPAPELSSRRLPPLPRQRPPIMHQDSSMSASTVATGESSIHTVMTTSASVSSLPAPLSDPNDLAARANSPQGMTLVSLEDSRATEVERSKRGLAQRAHAAPLPSPRTAQPSAVNSTFAQATPAMSPLASSPSPAPAPAKTLKNKKSGFLKLFNKSKDDHASAPAVPRGSSDTLPSPRFAVSLGKSSTKTVSPPRDLRKGGNSGPKTSADMSIVDESNVKTPVRTEFASALPFPHQQIGDLPVNQPNRSQRQQAASADPPRKAGSSAPPQVSLIKPSPDLGQHAFAGRDGGHLSPEQDRKVLAPSLSLRPVSMMITSMPPAFLAEMENSGNKAQQHLQAVQTPGSGGRSGFNTGGRTSPALTPDTPSFVFFDSDSHPSPQSGHTPSTPASTQFDDSPPNKSKDAKAVFGLPTPPHSASFSRTFSAASLPQVPTSPSIVQATSRETAIIAPYCARIAELEKLLQNTRAELARAQTLSASPDGLGAEGNTDKKSCHACGCDCTGKSSSILARPRHVGHGNMFSSGRD